MNYLYTNGTGSFYDDNIDEFLDSPVTYLYGSYDRSIRESINLADNNDIIINTVSIAAPYGANEYMDELVPKTGGKSYSDADGTADGMKDLINEITKDLDSQKEAQRQGDYDGDGLSDRAELDGMLGDNGRKYFSNPFTTDVDHDTDGDDVPDNVEMGEYDPETGMYNVLSDPANPNSIPTGYIRVPVYIIAWSYGTTYDVEPFEKRLKWDDTYSDLRKSISLVVDGYTDEWNQNVWEAFEEQSLFRWAAETKKRELINSGISESQIILLRIDGGAEFINYWKEWQTYEYIQELHIYSHGICGKPEMNNGGTLWWDGSKDGHLNSVPHNPDRDYPKLNFTENASVYFYGCHIAINKNAEGSDFYPNGDDYLQLFSDYQQVKVFANRYGTSFSSDPNVKELIFEPSIQNVYLGSYALDDFVMPHEDYSERSLGGFGIDNNYAIKYFDMGTQVNEFFVSNKLKRIPFVIYTPGEPIQ
ncbi:MAG: hypothetical protein K6C99_10280 [Lachnospiraceae bacterium]|nr:hypothetical protein [Lachnospiraceae bacterium]